VTVWNTTTWELEYELREHQGGVTDLDFSPDGSQLVTVGIDGTARVFDARTGESIFLLPTPGSGDHFVRFAPWHPDHLVVAAEDGIVSVLTLDREELMEIARDKLFRGFTPSECERFQLDSCDGGQ
jgi:WD40 repeat protein